MRDQGFEDSDVTRLSDVKSIVLQFVTELECDRAPVIEKYLDKVPESARPQLLGELILVELAALSVVDDATKNSYSKRFSAYGDLLDEIFSKDDSCLSNLEPRGIEVTSLKENLTNASGGTILSSATMSGPQKISESRYRLYEEIARGGMGAILKGHDNDLRRDLAIKVLLKDHKDRPEVIQRFIEEAQIGGQLQHPGIAPVYELGWFSDQRPFFSMKLVKGKTLSELLKGRKSPADRRGYFIGIFEQICQTVAYAHSRSVIHRDLKPANIMVGAFGEVQVMDWGLAKVLSEEKPTKGNERDTPDHERSVIQTRRVSGESSSGSSTGFDGAGANTQMGSVLGTPAYMPPEQALGEIDLMDQRTDVFGLGAILCVILTGKPPYDAENRKQVYRMACRGKIADCFERLDDCGADEELIDLAKRCLSVEQENRPGDAGILAEQMTNYLESVEAKLRQAQMQRAAEAARAVEERKRRRVSLALAGAVFLLLTVGGGAWLYVEHQEAKRQASLAAEQTRHANAMQKLAAARDKLRLAAVSATQDAEDRRAEAEEQMEISEKVAAFLGGLFQDVDPIARTGRPFGMQSRTSQGDLTALEVLRRGSKQLKTELVSSPRVRAQLLDRIGNVYINLDEVEEAAPLLEEALEIRVREFGPDSLPTAESIQSIGILETSLGRPQRATASFKRVLAIRRKHLGDNDLLIADALFHLGIQQSFSMQLEESEASLKECLAIRRAVLEEPNYEIASVLFTIAQLSIVQNQKIKAISALQEAASMADELNGNQEFTGIVTLFTQAQILQSVGNLRKALESFEEMEEKAIKLLGEDHLVVAFGRFFFASALTKMGEPELAIPKFEQLIAVYRRAWGADSVIIAKRLNELGRQQRIVGDLPSAETNLLEARRIFKLCDDLHPHAIAEAENLHLLGALNDNRGNREKAKELIHEAMMVLFDNSRSDYWRMQHLAHDYACILLDWDVNPQHSEFRNNRLPIGQSQLDLELAERWMQSANIAQDQRFDSNDPDERVTQYLQRQAVICLRSAFNAGYRNPEAIRSNKVFRGLADRDDFQELMSEISEAINDG
ncbi:MAG: tetratricopeptide repeat protein [Mariniblastus sp.]|nr:tetratricopeptide repeat protein [Mariniblastus sp.]